MTTERSADLRVPDDVQPPLSHVDTNRIPGAIPATRGAKTVRVRMNIALVYRDALSAGGYPRDVRWLAGALSRHCSNVWLLTGEGTYLDGLGDSQLVPKARCHEIAGRVDVAHTFGLFLPRQLLLQRRLHARANVVSPLGHLMCAHMKSKAWKKRPYIAGIRAYLLRNQPTVHVFSAAERSGLRRHLGDLPTFEASLGIFPAGRAAAPMGSAAAFAQGDYLLFFGRNDIYQKGIDRLIEAYAAAVQRGIRLQLLIAGAEFGRSAAFVQGLIKRAGLQDRVTVLGEVAEAEKWALIQGARALVYLSRWDGPPRPIREALSVGTPVIVSRGTNLDDLVNRSGAGVGVGMSREAATAAMLQADDERIVTRWRCMVPDVVEALEWNRVVDSYLDGYCSALQALPKGPAP